ncbi:MAG TPA: M24 family metallopeptidase [Longimicrobiales bacterium]|nr:M24 family metallopeptidase [Longimicrobiales bacterium]
MSDFRRLRSQLPEIQATLRELGLDGWLLYDLRARNKVADGLLGLGDLTRRYFVLVPAEGEPHALSHRIEEGPWAAWPWRRESYSAWRELDARLASLLAGTARVAMEVSPGDAVPILDLVPSGVVELIRRAGPEVVTSGDLVTRFYSRWSDDDVASHRRAAVALAQVAQAAFARLARAVAEGGEVTEADVHDWVLTDLARHGVAAGADCHVANTVNAADPHYHVVGRGARLIKGDVVLLDLWGKEAEDRPFADQTWMAYLGTRVPDRVAELFAIIRNARDAAVAFIRDAWAEGREVAGYEVDDVCRGVVVAGGFGDAFVHRTGHSIDQAIHGMGPNIDNLETHETRRLLPGIGFSIEPGIYLRGEIGLRTEIDVFMGPDGPEVTTPGPQDAILALYAG